MVRRAGGLLLLSTLGALAAAPAGAATQSAAVTANVVKPLTLTALQDLDLGTMTLQPGSWSGVAVGISRDGTLNCPNVNVICSGATRVAQYKVTGTNKQVVLISTPNVVLVNQADPTQKLTLVLDSPGQVTLTSSGEPGVNFPVGGSVSLSSTTATGTYSGTLNVTVDYQ